MRRPEPGTIAYIDGANLHKGAKSLGWDLDYRRFRIWLSDKYKVRIAYLFIGLVPKYKDLHTRLQEEGYVLVYKEVTYDSAGQVKGNCDADLVLRVACDYYEGRLRKAVLVTSDGDYAGLADFLREKGVLGVIVSPHVSCSYLLRKLNVPITYLDTLRGKLYRRPQKEKAPGGDVPR